MLAPMLLVLVLVLVLVLLAIVFFPGVFLYLPRLVTESDFK